MKKENGITLIALVITIVILVILAGVSINLVLGQNGIITRSKDAKTLMEETQANEQVALAEVSNQMEELIKGGNNNSPVQKTEPYANPYIPTGFTHTEGTWNDGYVIQDGIGNEFVWVPCVINQNQVKAGDTVVTFGKTLPTTTANTDPLYKYNRYNLGLLPIDTTVPAEDSSVSEIRTSVGTYGGFYIARYEAGVPGTTTSTTTNDANKQIVDGTQKPTSKAGVGVWNYINRTNSIIVSKAMIDSSTGAKSTLISGECWDTTIQWMVNASANKETNAGYDTNSTGKGNYTETINTTGYYAVNRIYDMAGNVYEFTTENGVGSDSSYLVFRGGCYGDSGSGTPAANRDYIDDDASFGISFRVVLYK